MLPRERWWRHSNTREEERGRKRKQRAAATHKAIFKKREVGNSIRAAETNEQSVINSARRLGLVALHQQRTLSSHVRQSEFCRRRLEREREMLTAGRPNDSLSGKHTSTEDRGSSPERQTSQPEVTHPYIRNGFIRKKKSRRDVWKTSSRTILTTINPSCNE